MNTLKKSLLGASVALALGGGVAPETQAIQVAANGIGQVLLAPVYDVSENGECAYITVTNPSMTHAIKAKVVIRSKINSVEVLDFILYLTPGDVWRGEICNRDGQAWLHSEDDSMINLHYPLTGKPVAFANEDPADIQLFDKEMLKVSNDQRDNPLDINEIGHIEIIGHYSVTGSVNVAGEVIHIFCGMSKHDLRKLFDLPVYNFTRVPEGTPQPLDSIVEYNGAYNADGNCSIVAPNTTYPGLSNPNCPVRIDDGTVRLIGNVEMVGTNQARVSYRMTALASSRVFNRNVSNLVGLGQVPVAGFGAGSSSYHNAVRAAADGDGNLIKKDNAPGSFREITGTHVIANPFLEITGTQTTDIGANWGFNRGEIEGNPMLPMKDGAPVTNISYDNILEIERALATSFVADSYENGEVNGADRTTGIQLTFPTKYRHWEKDICGGLEARTGTPFKQGSGLYSPPFEMTGCVRHGFFSVGNFECSSPPPEIEFSGLPGDDPDDDKFYCNEVEFDYPEFADVSGQYKVYLFPAASPLDDLANCSGLYDGVPAIAHTVKFTSSDEGVTVTNPTMTPASESNWAWQ